MRLVAEGKVAVEGAFLAGPRVTGRMIIRALDINIPDRFPGGVQDLQVRHVNDRRNRTARGPAPRPASAPNTGIALNLVVSAPNNNVFVRGLGMEAELGGEITVTGTTGAPVTLGAFELRRGNFDILGRRLTFTRGRIAFTGTTDPELDFIAETSSTDVTAKILVTGPASKPEISFTSTPTLPQDEVCSAAPPARSPPDRRSRSLRPLRSSPAAQACWTACGARWASTALMSAPTPPVLADRSASASA